MNNYESYKETDIPWLGEIPSHWEIKRVKRFFYIFKDISYKKNPVVLSLARDKVKIRDIESNKGQLAENYNNYNSVKKGDLLLNPMDLYSGANCNISNYDGVISPAYINLRSNKDISVNFFDYIFKLQYTSLAFQSVGKGVSKYNRWTLSNETLLNYQLPIPPISEQIQIANYLDWKINEIDKLILIEKEQIKELENLKQKYIDKLINSISSEFKPLKSIFEFGKGLSITKENLGENGVKCISYGEIHNKFIFSFSSTNPNLKGLEKTEGIIISKFAELKKNDFIFADTSEDLKGCGNFTFLEDDVKRVYAGYHTVVAKPILTFNPRYVAYYLESNKWRKQIRMEVKGIKVYSITQAILKSSKLQLPEIDIQESVSKKIDAFVQYKNALISIMDEKISNLQALKQSLIAEVVTGKIDVRNITIPQYEKVETILETDNIDETEVQDYGD
jgi:TYPE I RESTRICTION-MODIFICATION SYSTEM SPECIFICITY SUBUNIT